MIPLILKKPRVAGDLNTYFDFIAMDKLEPAERFLRFAEESFARLAAMPRIEMKWESRNSRLPDIRFYPMPGPFRSYLIFYRPIAGGIEVLAVMHGARDLAKRMDDVLD